MRIENIYMKQYLPSSSINQVYIYIVPNINKIIIILCQMSIQIYYVFRKARFFLTKKYVDSKNFAKR